MASSATVTLNVGTVKNKTAEEGILALHWQAGDASCGNLEADAARAGNREILPLVQSAHARMPGLRPGHSGTATRSAAPAVNGTGMSPVRRKAGCCST